MCPALWKGRNLGSFFQGVRIEPYHISRKMALQVTTTRPTLILVLMSYISWWNIIGTEVLEYVTPYVQKTRWPMGGSSGGQYTLDWLAMACDWIHNTSCRLGGMAGGLVYSDPQRCGLDFCGWWSGSWVWWAGLG